MLCIFRLNPCYLSKFNLSLDNPVSIPFYSTFEFIPEIIPFCPNSLNLPVSTSLFHPHTNVLYRNFYQINTSPTFMPYICNSIPFVASYTKAYTLLLLKAFLARSLVTLICQIHEIYPDFILFSSFSIFHRSLNPPTKIPLPSLIFCNTIIYFLSSFPNLILLCWLFILW